MEFLDQMGNTIRLPEYPRRIISLFPSLTELLFDLGLDDEIIGVTSYCVLPQKKLANRFKVGGIKKFLFQVIDELQPDLIIGNKEENYPEGIHQLQEKYPVWMSDITTIEDMLQMIRSVGKLVNRSEKAEQLIDEIEMGLKDLNFYPLLKVAYLIWKNPYLAVGGNTFINELLHLCGFINIFEKKSRYPRINAVELDEAEVILLSSEPYPFTSEDVETFRNRYSTQYVYRVDGAMFSWYGSRIKYTPAYCKSLRETLRKEHGVGLI